MNIFKVLKDHVLKAMFGNMLVPRGLHDLERYFRLYHSISFERHSEGGLLVSVSTDFRHGSIVAHGRDEAELDRNVRDAILTSFEVPSAYVAEARLVHADGRSRAYALA